jgi:hypothetical protein
VLIGLISAAPGESGESLRRSAKQVEGIICEKISQKEFTILCLEDSNDWSNATTRQLVAKVPTQFRSTFPGLMLIKMQVLSMFWL